MFLSETNNKGETMEAHYSVTFVADYFTLTVVASVPSRDDDDPAYSDDPSAIDVAGEIICEQYGFDPRPYAYDINVEPAF